MSIPRTRRELVDVVTETFADLRSELDDAGPGAGVLPCVDDWSVKDLLVVRAWWTEVVVQWIETGRRGQSPSTPAPGYSWRETPRLNADLIRRGRAESFPAVRKRLERGFRRVLTTIDSLGDRELLETGTFEWAGKWPVSRWSSINTARQYVTARRFLRKALSESGEAGARVRGKRPR